MIYVFTKYGRKGASSRVRFFQYFSHITPRFSISVNFLLDDLYLEKRYSNERFDKLYLLFAFTLRIIAIVKLLFARRRHIIWIEKELIPFFPSFFETLLFIRGHSIVVDFDDAEFHKYDQHRYFITRLLFGRKIQNVMRRSRMLLVGNDYLRDYALKSGVANQNILIMPSTVTTWHLRKKSSINQPFRVGWIGSPASAKYLLPIKDQINYLQKKGIEFRIVGAGQEIANRLGINCIEWSESVESTILDSLDVGIMPLPDSDWEKGKCAYKILQYLSHSKPVIASPVGVNTLIVEHKVNGYLAYSDSDWVRYVLELKSNPALAFEMGKAGNEKCREHYDKGAWGNLLRDIFIDLESEIN